MTKIEEYRKQIKEANDPKAFIIAINEDAIRTQLIAENIHLFDNKPTEQPKVKTVYDEELGMNIPEEMQKKLKREKIMSIKDPREREQMIMANIELFN